MKRLRKITIHEDGEVDYFFEGSDEPFVPWEFSENSPTRKYLMDIQNAIKAEIPASQEKLFEDPTGLDPGIPSTGQEYRHK